MQQPFLIGERVYLRPLELEDADRVRGWLNHPDVRRFLGRGSPIARLGEEKFLRGLAERAASDHERVLLIVEREGDRPVGTIGLHPDRAEARSAILGIAIGEPDAQGRGLGAAAIELLLRHAFHELGIHRVGLFVYAFNARAVACYEKVGFVREGVLRQEHFADGRYHDTIVMSVLAPEWSARRA